MAKRDPGDDPVGGDRPRFHWCFARQEGLCYLGIHHKCAKRARLMTLEKPTKGYSARTSADPFAGAVATWEHVLPRAMRVPHQATLKLLACYDCNHAKGDAAPSIEHVQLALQHGREWFERPELVKLHGPNAAAYVAQLDAAAKRFIRWAEGDELARAELLAALAMPPKQAAKERKRARQAKRAAEYAAQHAPLNQRIARANALGVQVFGYRPERKATDEERAAAKAQQRAERAEHRAALKRQYGGAAYRRRVEALERHGITDPAFPPVPDHASNQEAYEAARERFAKAWANRGGNPGKPPGR